MTTSPPPPPGSPLRTGGRIELRRRDQHPLLGALAEEGTLAALAVYEAYFWTPGSGWIGELIVSASGAVTARIDGDRPPAWLVDFGCQVLRTIARNVTGSPPSSWPRRVTRWRAAPEER